MEFSMEMRAGMHWKVWPGYLFLIFFLAVLFFLVYFTWICPFVWSKHLSLLILCGFLEQFSQLDIWFQIHFSDQHAMPSVETSHSVSSLMN